MTKLGSHLWDGRHALMLLGFAAAFAGDWFLAIQGASRGSGEFLAGVAAFSLAQVFWMAAHAREAQLSWRPTVVLAIPLGCFFGVRLCPVLDVNTAVAIGGYSFLSAVALSWALSTRRLWYSLGIALLLVSDLMIGSRWLEVPFAGEAVGPLYIAAELSLWTSFFLRDEKRLDFRRGNPFSIGLWTIFLSLLVFLLGMATFPGGDYNPCMRMLSALGRTEIRLVEYPLCHFLFILGMLISALGIARISAILTGTDPKLGSAFAAGAAFNVTGLLLISVIPEDVNANVHNAGCWTAAVGGGIMLVSWLRTGKRGQTPSGKRGQTPWGMFIWPVLLFLPCLLLGLGLMLHCWKIIDFAPWVPTAQKALILSFMIWFLRVSWTFAPKSGKRVAIAMAVLIICLGWVVLGPNGIGDRPPVCDTLGERGDCPHVGNGDCPHSGKGDCPLTEDESAALKWLEFVSGKMSAEDEKRWWCHGEKQFGIFSLRYNIAFVGYAAAAIGLKASDDPAVRKRVGKVLGDCIGRYLQPEVWGYSQSKSYWGRKPWAPDPCYRENVMYTGHLLQLLAFYELMTGDTRYWTKGFDFVWKGRRVHYTVKKLIDVSVHQMRKGPNGGIACEPGLMFFPCNNHPHVALKVFARLGHGDWSADARRWERWALAHYRRPFFGGGALNLVYHVKSGLLYPRGSSGLDGWSLLWYEAWAQDRRTALGLWREAVAAIDWDELWQPDDERAGADCNDPEPVSGALAAVFLSAAARACDDVPTAERLEKAVDERYLVRRNGLYFLNLDRRWRIGATAERIVALLESNGFGFRRALDYGVLPCPRLARDCSCSASR